MWGGKNGRPLHYFRTKKMVSGVFCKQPVGEGRRVCVCVYLSLNLELVIRTHEFYRESILLMVQMKAKKTRNIFKISTAFVIQFINLKCIGWPCHYLVQKRNLLNIGLFSASATPEKKRKFQKCNRILLISPVFSSAFDILPLCEGSAQVFQTTLEALNQHSLVHRSFIGPLQSSKFHFLRGKKKIYSSVLLENALPPSMLV